MKTCTRCGTEKPLDAFSFRTGRGIYYARCRQCMTDVAREKYKPEYQQRWREKNEQHIKERDKERNARRDKAMLASKARDARAKDPSKSRMANKRASNELKPGYVAKVMGLHVDDLSPELLELKRQQLQLRRMARQLRNANEASKDSD